MTKEKILKKAVEKAEKNGFYYSWRDKSGNDNMPEEWWFDRNRYYQVVFNKAFAKAFWGEEGVCCGCGENADKNYDDGICKNCADGASWDDNIGDMEDKPAWQYHLQQMVLEEDPIKYLEQFLDN